jgi:hypothetical protein
VRTPGDVDRTNVVAGLELLKIGENLQLLCTRFEQTLATLLQLGHHDVAGGEVLQPNVLGDKVLLESLQQAAVARFKADAERFAVKDDKDRAALKAWEKFRDSFMLRAADLRSPAQNGHFLRDFGQSDRVLVENSNDDASVSQALMLLNGKTFSGLMNKYTSIARSMDRARKDGGGEAVIDAVYLSLLSRKASAEEKALLKPIADNADTTDRGDVLWTVLNTRQFFFIQ